MNPSFKLYIDSLTEPGGMLEGFRYEFQMAELSNEVLVDFIPATRVDSAVVSIMSPNGGLWRCLNFRASRVGLAWSMAHELFPNHKLRLRVFYDPEEQLAPVFTRTGSVLYTGGSPPPAPATVWTRLNDPDGV